MQKELELGIEQIRGGQFQEAYQLFLTVVEKATVELRDNPSYQTIELAKRALEEAKGVLKRVEERDSTSYSSPSAFKSNPTKLLVIPISPLIKKLRIHQQLKDNATDSYQDAVSKDPTQETLKSIRFFLQEMESEGIMINNINRQILSVRDSLITRWNPTVFAYHCSSITKTLYNCLDLSENCLVTDLSKLSTLVIKFFAFQQYLSVTFLDSIKSFENHDGYEYLIGVMKSLFYEQHDLATMSTILRLLNRDRNFLTLCSSENQQTLNEINQKYGDHNLIIQIEILNDMISYHPITSVSTTIVPDLQLFVETSMDQAIGAVDSKSIPGKVIQTDLLQKCQYHSVVGNDSDFKLDDSIIHWILSRPYHYINNEHFWYGICQNFPDGYKVEPLPIVPIQEVPNHKNVGNNDVDYSLNTNDMPEFVDDEPSPTDEKEDIQTDLMKRLAALRNK
ncbi:hypothetical protein BC833DRAFT_618549 [Globomyces pollinis-pini]|nr:hypothetical protein BC833DRAFT_618549 [Globomyces pollinis-pini]